MITHRRQANEAESELVIHRNDRDNGNQAQKGQQRKQSTEAVIKRTRRMIAAGRRMEWSHWLTIGAAPGLPTAGLMPVKEEKQTRSTNMLGKLDRPGTESSWLFEA